MSETADSHTQSVSQERTSRARWLYIAPVAAFVVLALALGIGLGRDPSLVPSALVGAPAPDTALPPVDDYGPGFSAADFKDQVTLVNVFASWCTSCRYEHPLLMDIAAADEIMIFGLAYKDDPADSATWLARYGNPYDATGADILGRAGIEWGVYGVPETFVVGPDGTVAYKHIGPITAEAWRDTILPVIAGLQP
ncbi:MAG: DsbE family thiol:disulfide interchange protein [Rhodospirillaceae bacterium]|nr:DsbE family thiol:disulfide interchange protein [Rhodospirillaceae bacterium]|tara:strand:+ start:1292 stop:1876 length:585 start_codon:yes stop_codon:yes gene_type:complete